MKAATIQEIKQELSDTSAAKLKQLCLHLAKFKKENKELLTYLLFESHDEASYIQEVKSGIEEGFKELPKSNNYLNKKTLRKILRIANKHIKYMASKQAEATILMHFCQELKSSGIPFQKTAALSNLYQQQIKKIKAAIATLHEDLQYDFHQQLNNLAI
jgi:gas vesicle protein